MAGSDVWTKALPHSARFFVHLVCMKMTLFSSSAIRFNGYTLHMCICALMHFPCVAAVVAEARLVAASVSFGSSSVAPLPGSAAAGLPAAPHG